MKEKFDDQINFIVEDNDISVAENTRSPSMLNERVEISNFNEVEVGEEILVMDRNVEFEGHIKITTPGQGKKPVSWHLIADLDELTFPKIFVGHALKIPPEVKITYSDRVKSECWRRNRRACTTNRLLYMTKKKL